MVTEARYMTDKFRFSLIIGCYCWIATAAASAEADFALEEVAPGIFLHRGQMADLDSPARADSANIGFIVGSRCVAVVDTGGAAATGHALKAAIAGVTAKPVCYVINTHVHFDHVLGNAAFVGEAVRFVGHQHLADAMAANRDFFAESFADELGGAAQGARVIAPDLLVDDHLVLDLGGRHLRLQAAASSHTTTDLTVYDNATETLWTGDLLFRQRMPILDGSLSGWIRWMDHAMASTYALVIPGHGPVDREWPHGAQAQYRYLTALLIETRAAIAKGLFIDKAQAEVAAAERERWLLSERAHGLNISRAFRQLEWE
jgi:quinoprotein relay system zinc metallohydrolase 2